MNNIEKLADNLGQVIFRLELNLRCIRKHMDAIGAIEDDIEKLKQYKQDILALTVNIEKLEEIKNANIPV